MTRGSQVEVRMGKEEQRPRGRIWPSRSLPPVAQQTSSSSAVLFQCVGRGSIGAASTLDERRVDDLLEVGSGNCPWLFGVYHLTTFLNMILIVPAPVPHQYVATVIAQTKLNTVEIVQLEEVDDAPVSPDLDPLEVPCEVYVLRGTTPHASSVASSRVPAPSISCVNTPVNPNESGNNAIWHRRPNARRTSARRGTAKQAPPRGHVRVILHPRSANEAEFAWGNLGFGA